MRTTLLLAASAVALAACGSATEDRASTADAESGETQQASWTYENPASWGTVHEEYATCATGTVQSPINLVRAEATDSEDVTLEINWESGPMIIDGAGYNSDLVAPEGGYIMLEGTRYDFLQVHVHVPSEYTIEGEQPAGDIHFVHANADGELAVIGVSMTEGEPNTVLAAAFEAFSNEEGAQTFGGITFDPNALLPETRSFFRFPGSLTTPPCSEGVNWVFMSEPVTVSADQIAAYTALYGNTARPVQPTGDREILFVEG
ncbi:carbonic anhydrase [Parasphingopyxis sp.]|uniref:carbonic anhydrase n=1 Tax=Parasphingopyxis sp. TaxID=1920299 RepID=UPI0026052D83|nr:carbonic anhydrase family protein [Parasphingopyxis sp.]